MVDPGLPFLAAIVVWFFASQWFFNKRALRRVSEAEGLGGEVCLRRLPLELRFVREGREFRLRKLFYMGIVSIHSCELLCRTISPVVFCAHRNDGCSGYPVVVMGSDGGEMTFVHEGVEVMLRSDARAVAAALVARADFREAVAGLLVSKGPVYVLRRPVGDFVEVDGLAWADIEDDARGLFDRLGRVVRAWDTAWAEAQVSETALRERREM